MRSSPRENFSIKRSGARQPAVAGIITGSTFQLGGRGRCPQSSPWGSYEFAEDYRKIGIFCRRTKSSAPTEGGASKDFCRGRRLCRPEKCCEFTAGSRKNSAICADRCGHRPLSGEPWGCCISAIFILDMQKPAHPSGCAGCQQKIIHKNRPDELTFRTKADRM